MGLVVENSKKLCTKFEKITVDEQLIAFCGKCPMKQYMKSKSAKYRITICAAADVKTSYLYNLQVFTGKLQKKAPETNLGNKLFVI